MINRLYKAIVDTRNALYERGVFKSFSLGVPTFSVGNITVGGTGKTPLVALLTEILAENGEKVCIVTRGYGRENPKSRVLVSDGKNISANARQAGDEPLELARKLSGKAIVVADANRVAAGIWARENFNVSAFVLDDAFQHRRVRRDLDIVTIDATDPFGNEKLLPFGTLREPLENIKRADAVVITRANLNANSEDLKFVIKKYNLNNQIFVSENRITNLTKLKDFNRITQKGADAENKEQTIKNKSLAFCALGNSDNFFEQLMQENFNLVFSNAFSDHHFYTQSDVEKIEKSARKIGAEILLTTAKDAVKLKELKFEMPCFVVESEMFFDDENGFRDLITAATGEYSSKIKNS